MNGQLLLATHEISRLHCVPLEMGNGVNVIFFPISTVAIAERRDLLASNYNTMSGQLLLATHEISRLHCVPLEMGNGVNVIFLRISTVAIAEWRDLLASNYNTMSEQLLHLTQKISRLHCVPLEMGNGVNVIFFPISTVAIAERRDLPHSSSRILFELLFYLSN